MSFIWSAIPVSSTCAIVWVPQHISFFCHNFVVLIVTMLWQVSFFINWVTDPLERSMRCFFKRVRFCREMNEKCDTHLISVHEKSSNIQSFRLGYFSTKAKWESLHHTSDVMDQMCSMSMSKAPVLALTSHFHITAFIRPRFLQSFLFKTIWTQKSMGAKMRQLNSRRKMVFKWCCHSYRSSLV